MANVEQLLSTSADGDSSLAVRRLAQQQVRRLPAPASPALCSRHRGDSSRESLAWAAVVHRLADSPSSLQAGSVAVSRRACAALVGACLLGVTTQEGSFPLLLGSSSPPPARARKTSNRQTRPPLNPRSSQAPRATHSAQAAIPTPSSTWGASGRPATSNARSETWTALEEPLRAPEGEGEYPTHLHLLHVARQAAKLDCLLTYLNAAAGVPDGAGGGPEPPSVVFQRVVLPRPVPDAVAWVASRARLCKVAVVPAGSMEASAQPLLADFANMYLGGGVLGRGCVQEEIMFVQAPECLVGLLLCEQMEDNESVHIMGARYISETTGYAGGFRWARPRDPPAAGGGGGAGGQPQRICAMDALHLRQRGRGNMFDSQFELPVRHPKPQLRRFSVANRHPSLKSETSRAIV